MIYPWICKECGKVTDAIRRLSEIDIPPEKCDHCSSTNFSSRTVELNSAGVKGFILVDNGVGWAGHGFYTPKDWRK